MDKPNGSRPAERLAAALKPTYDVAKVAEALQDCMDSAVERAAERAADRAADRAAEKVKQEMLPTLRMIWKQCKGDPNQRLPIDD